MRCQVELSELFTKKIDYNEIIKKVKKHNLFSRLITFLLSMLLLALVFNLFLKPLNIVAGGSSGVSIILNEAFSLDITLTTYIIYISTLILSAFFLSKEITLSLVIATIVYPFLVEVTENVTDYIVFSYSNPLLICIFAGILSGVATGLILKVGFNSGGLIVIAQVIYRYFKISISKSNLVINIIIVLIGGYYFGVSNILYAIIVMYISSIVTDKVMLGISSNKCFFITTTKEKEITNFITNYIYTGVTLIETYHDDKVALMCAVPTSKYFVFKEGITKIDNKATWFASDSYQVFGEFKGGKYGHNKNEKRS